MSITPITLTSGATRGMSPEEAERMTKNVHTLYTRLRPRDASQPMNEVYSMIRELPPDQQVQALSQLYSDIESVLGQYKMYSREHENAKIAYLREARKETHKALVARSTEFLNKQALEGVTVNVDRGPPLRIVRADVLLGTNEDPALPMSTAIALLDQACFAAGIQLPKAVVDALPQYFAQMRATMSAKPAVVKKQRV